MGEDPPREVLVDVVVDVADVVARTAIVDPVQAG